MTMPQPRVDLAGLFEAAARELAASQQTINQADAYNGNHGSNMVDTFQTISGALEKKRGSSASTALNYAARQVAHKSSSGSGQLYAQNLARAAGQFKGKRMDERGALELLQTLIGGGQPAAAQPGQSPSSTVVQGDEMLGAQLGGGQNAPTSQTAGEDTIGALLGGLAGAQTAPGQNPAGSDLLGSLLGGLTSSQAGSGGTSAPAGGDLLGSLLGGLAGSQGQGPQGAGQPGIDMGDLVNAATAFMQAKQSGGNTTQALVQAFMAGSGMGRSSHREQSTQVVVNSFLNALSQRS